MPIQLPDNMSPYAMKLYILERVSANRNGKAAKQTIVGQGSSHPGDLERIKEWRFSDEQRGFIYGLIQELCTSGFFMPSLGEPNPELWCVITDAGRAALTRGALDSLDSALLQIDRGLLDRRHGAWAAYHSLGVDSLSHASNSTRELLSQSLRALAPNAEVQGKAWWVADPTATGSGGVTRAHRIRLALEKRALEDDDREIAEATCALAERWQKKLNTQIHTGAGLVAEDVKHAIEAVEAAVKLLLGVA
jgi:hypothetical protein